MFFALPKAPTRQKKTLGGVLQIVFALYSTNYSCSLSTSAAICTFCDSYLDDYTSVSICGAGSIIGIASHIKGGTAKMSLSYLSFHYISDPEHQFL